MINVQVKANSLKHLEFGTKRGRDKSLGYKAAGFIPSSAGIHPAELHNLKKIHPLSKEALHVKPV
jgi:hypothetical protein